MPLFHPLTALKAYLAKRRARRLAEYQHIMGSAWIAFERGAISLVTYERIKRDLS